MNRLLALGFVVAAVGPAHAKVGPWPPPQHRAVAFQLPARDTDFYGKRQTLELSRGAKVVVDSAMGILGSTGESVYHFLVLGKQTGSPSRMLTLSNKERTEVTKMFSPRFGPKSRVEFYSPPVPRNREGRNEAAIDDLTSM